MIYPNVQNGIIVKQIFSSLKYCSAQVLQNPTSENTVANHHASKGLNSSLFVMSKQKRKSASMF